MPGDGCETTPSTQERPFSSISIQGNTLRENYAPFVGSTSTPLDAGLSPLGDHGGTTMTHALLSTSSAIDTGSNAVATAYDLEEDQRGSERVVDWEGGVDARVDVGAFELAFAEMFS